MLKQLAAQLCGSLRVRASGDFPERALNVCSARGIEFWDPRFAEGAVSFSIRRGDWRAARAACDDAGTEIHIARASGVPFVLGRLRRRAALSAGLAVCAALLAANACFIWDIQVEGNAAVPDERILRVLADNGVRRGTFVFSIHQRKLCNRVLLEIPELSWLTVNARGCRAHVIVRERVPKPEIVNESAPTNVIAKRDALVTDVRALDGEARVLRGTTVRRGQLLISGVVETKGVESPSVRTRYLAGKGEVWGRTWYELSTKIPLYAEMLAPTGEEKSVHAVAWAENRAKLSIKGAGNLPVEYDRIISRKQWTLPGGFALPVTWTTETCRPCALRRVERTRGEAEALGREVLERELRTRLGADGEIVSVRMAGAVQGDWLLVTLSAECVEQIGVTVPIAVD